MLTTTSLAVKNSVDVMFSDNAHPLSYMQYFYIHVRPGTFKTLPLYVLNVLKTVLCWVNSINIKPLRVINIQSASCHC